MKGKLDCYTNVTRGSAPAEPAQAEAGARLTTIQNSGSFRMHGRVELTKISRSASGASARGNIAYIYREWPYGAKGGLAWKEAGNLPAWAASAQQYFAYGDSHARANARVANASVISLPRGLSKDQEILLARNIIQVTLAERHPWAAALHRPPEKDNPHLHLTWDNKRHDGYERSPSQWWRRYNPEAPEKGGAPVERGMEHRRGVQALRQGVADAVNISLEAWEKPPRYYTGKLTD